MHAGHPSPIIDREIFTACNALVDERAESQRLRASHSSDYDRLASCAAAGVANAC